MRVGMKNNNDNDDNDNKEEFSLPVVKQSSDNWLNIFPHRIEFGGL